MPRRLVAKSRVNSLFKEKLSLWASGLGVKQILVVLETHKNKPHGEQKEVVTPE